MKSIKIRIGRVVVLMTAMIVLLTTANGCIGNRLLNLKPVYAQKLVKTKTKYKIQVSLPEDVRHHKQPGDFIGHIKNGYGVRMADVTATQYVNIWVQNCISKNLKQAGFDVATGKKETGRICVSTSIRTLKCEAMMTYNAVIVLDVKLKKDNLIFFKKVFTGRSSQTNWAASTAGYQETMTNAMKQCLDKMMPVLIQKLEGSKKLIQNAAIVPVKKISKQQMPKTVTKQQIKAKKDSKKSLDDIYF